MTVNVVVNETGPDGETVWSSACETCRLQGVGGFAPPHTPPTPSCREQGRRHCTCPRCWG